MRTFHTVTRVGPGCPKHPVKVSNSELKTMYDSDRNDLEGTDVLKSDIEETILRYCWAKTDECPACGCESSLRIGVETEGEETASAPDCQLCDAVVRTIADGVEFDLI